MKYLYPAISRVFENIGTTHTEAAFHSRVTAFADQTVTGYVHINPNANSVLITSDLIPYLLPAETIMRHNLTTGDRLDADVAYSHIYDRHMVVAVSNITHVDYDDDSLSAPSATFKIGDTDINFGSTALIKDGDILETVAVAPANTETIILSFDGRQPFENHTVYRTKLSYSNRDKVTVCLLAFFRAKELTTAGKDVVLIIDSFDKMFHVYNNCVASISDDFVDPNHISLIATTDFESIICSGGVIKDGGSLTIVGLHKAGTTPPQVFLTDRLNQICDVII